MDVLSQAFEVLIQEYYRSQAYTQTFSAFVIAKLLKSSQDLQKVGAHLASLWLCLDKNQTTYLLANVYSRFINDIWGAPHIAFYMQTHIIIDQVCNGDSAFQ